MQPVGIVVGMTMNSGSEPENMDWLACREWTRLSVSPYLLVQTFNRNGLSDTSRQRLDMKNIFVGGHNLSPEVGLVDIGIPSV